MARRFEYPCPDCRSTNDLHEAGCRFEGVPWHEVEAAYVDLLAVLSAEPRGEEALREEVAGEWDALRAACLDHLQTVERVRETEDDRLRLLTPEQYRDAVTVPTMEPLRTIYEKGSVHGCHDNSVFALVAYYEMVGLSWEETSERVVEWLHDSGTWARGGFEEDSPEALLAEKRHVYEQGYGWKEKAKAAKAVIDRSL